ncbi:MULTISPECIES: hypothetical protein [unclassified Rhizobium]|uniref:hypothetical protein n=1 Tax=unclassified Rhizobium TaxID=2613769 RepID=UPI0006F30C2F|nr:MULTISPECIES: hypothetical protein [unclassified Rhizobium]KQV43812.1 hypothetical protein ASC86_03155 [Rhizobium sp. Root1212]KRD37995.1 hypothetical protein ASE37_03155 [Rhizobium sp. Root268]
MTVSTSNLWKSASATLRQPARMRETNLHIGSTLRDLFNEPAVKTEGVFVQLLDKLETAERTEKEKGRR